MDRSHLMVEVSNYGYLKNRLVAAYPEADEDTLSDTV